MLNMMPERVKSSFAKVMTALTVVAGTQITNAACNAGD